MRHALVICIVLMSVLVGPPATTHAQGGTTVSYPAGWSMVGGPEGSDFSAASDLQVYQSGAYQPAASRKTKVCQGYWASFTAPTQVTLAAESGSTSQTCQLQAGWNMVGNPFERPALLPSDTTSFYWRNDLAAYQTVTSIPVGAAVWINSDTARSVTLQRQPKIVVISSPSLPGPFEMHVGEQLELLDSADSTDVVSADPAYLQLIDAGVKGTLTCVGEPICAPVSIVERFWTWQAIAPGTTFIVITPGCRFFKPPCEAPSRQIEIDILP